MSLWELTSLRGVDGWMVFVFLVGVVFLIARRQNDALETTETAVRMLMGMLLAVLLLVYYSILGGTLWVEGAEVINSRVWEVVLAVVFFMPLVMTIGMLAVYPFYWRRKWRLSQLSADEPDVQEVYRLADWLGVARRRLTVWRAGVIGMRTPVVFRPVWGQAMVVLPMWDWRTQFADDPAGKEAVGEFVLLHELGHIKNGDATFVTWATMFLMGFRWWFGLVGLVQVAGLLLVPTGWLRMSLWLGLSATGFSFVVFNLLFLSVLRRRELLADARAQLYMGEARMQQLLAKTRLFATSKLGSWQEVRPAGRRIPRWPSIEPTAFLPVLPWEPLTPRRRWLMTHPTRSERHQSLKERDLIQSTKGVLSKSAVLWVSLVASLFVFFFYSALLYMSPSQSEVYLSSTSWSVLFLAMIYPGIAFALPMRNSAAHLQLFSAQFRQVLRHVGWLWLAYLVVAGVGYVSLVVGFALRGWTPVSLWNDYLTIMGIQFVFAPLTTCSLFFFARVLFMIMNRESKVTIVWFWSLIVAMLLVITIGVNGVLRLADSLFLIPTNVFMVTVLLGCIIGVLLNLGLSASFDARRLIMEAGVFGRFYWWEWRNPAGYIVWGTVVILGFFTLLFGVGLAVTLVILPLVDLGYWLLLFLVSLLAILLVAMLAISRRPDIEQSDFRQDTSQLLEVGLLLEQDWALAYQPAETPAGLNSMAQVFWAHCPVVSYQKVVDSVPKTLPVEYRDFVVSSGVESGGFALRPGGYARLISTYQALTLLAPNIPNTEQHADWLMGQYETNGGFASPTSRKPTVEATWLALQSLAVLGELGRVDKVRCAEWVWGRWLASGRDLAVTHYAVVCLDLLGGLGSGRVALIQQNWLPRYHSLSAGLRVDKQIEPIWHYCHIVTTLFAHEPDTITHYTKHLNTNLKEESSKFFA